MKVLTNHLGYSTAGPKKAVLQGRPEDRPQGFVLLDAEQGEVLRGTLREHGTVARWNTGFYWTADFSELRAEGTYVLRADTAGGQVFSGEFEIRDKLITMRMINAVGYYFKAQRSSGEWLLCDRDLPFKGGYREGRVDAHGGWFDASGDYGIHLSHLSHSSFYNPQQASFSAYTFFKACELLEKSGNQEYFLIKRRLLDEGTFGADFLMRLRAPSGNFFRSVNRLDSWGTVFNSRVIGFEYHHSSGQFGQAASAGEERVGDAYYETSLRSGGGLAIAALAIAARHFYPGGDYGSSDYIMAAKRAWAHLEVHNEKYTNDGEWNLIDEYCALMALTELYRSADELAYLHKARTMAERIYGRMVYGPQGEARLTMAPGYPFHHASDEGMPVAALLQYAEIESDPALRARAVKTCEDTMRFKLALSDRLSNPFGYPKFEHRGEDGGFQVKFFFPHQTRAAPWWQGENARLASLSAAARFLADFTGDPALKSRLITLAQDCLDWIMGCNPFDSCMIEGYGRNNVQYFCNNRHEFLNCPGGIINGITSGLDDEEGIEYISRPGGKVEDNWRWGEQWIPHASWYLYAMALKGE
ncbi:MAG: glycoside hydrolase family 9 protein [Treponema sp.]|jgi:hypothetical protein|nr:glycoside hydrolase family 9 protein [Treponema sp.]